MTGRRSRSGLMSVPEGSGCSTSPVAGARLREPLDLKLLARDTIDDSSVAERFGEFHGHLIHAGLLIVATRDVRLGNDAYLVL